jgi:antitoxin VapB
MDKNSTSKTATTRVFKSGNSQAVRIPAEMAFERTDVEFTITRTGDVITLRPALARQSIEEMFAILRAMPPESKFGPIERTQTRDTEWDR